MKRLMSFSFIPLLIGVLLVGHSPAQDYTPWGLPDGALARLRKGTIGAVAYSPDGTRLAVASSIGIWLYDARTLAEVALLTGHTGTVRSVSFSPDSRTLASGSGGNTVRLWDVDTGQERATLKGHAAGVTSVSFSPDGQNLASGSGDGTILLWDMALSEGKDESIDTAVSWCTAAQTVVVSFLLQKNGKTASICRHEAKSMVYSFGNRGGKPELEYRGPIIGEISARPPCGGRRQQPCRPRLCAWR